MPKVSVVVAAYNEELYINRLIDSILRQSFKDIELIIIDDCSTDRTPRLIQNYTDARIQYVRNEKNMKVTKSTNVGIERASGEYVFFTGGDCAPLINWIEVGVNGLMGNADTIGIYGDVMYPTSRVTIADRIVETRGQIFGANMAFKTKILKTIGGMNPEYEAQEDRDLAYRMRKFGKIIYCPDMIVIHQRKMHSRRSIFSDAKRAKNMVRFIKCYKDIGNENLYWKVLYPRRLLAAFLPPVIVLAYNFRSLYDIKVAFWFFIGAWYMRVVIWRAAIKERIFLI